MQSSLLFFVPFQWAVLPAAVYLASRIIDTLLVWSRFRPNPNMANVITGKVTAQFPGSTAPSQQPLVVIQLASRSNHALGAFHPLFQVVGKYFERMILDLEQRSEEFGYLGSKSYLTNERTACNEAMTQIYFRNYEGMHKFAHETDGVHREGWNFWNTVVMGKDSTVRNLFSIMHEVYEIPAKHWETIYINYHPTSMGATTFRINGKDGTTQWASPLVDARTGLLRTSKGRRATTKGDDNDMYEDVTYA